MNRILKTFLMGVLFTAIGVIGTSAAKADPVTFFTTGTFSASGTNIAVFGSVPNQTTLTFTGATLTMVNTPAGANFGHIVSTSTVPLGAAGPAITGTFTLNFFQTAPSGGMGSLVGSLSGTLGSNQGITTLTFTPNTSINIGGFTYTVNQTYTIVLPTTGTPPDQGDTSLQGTVVGSAVPEPFSMLLLGTGLVGVAGAVRKRFRR